MTTRYPLISLLLLLVVAVSTASAANFYRWSDADGNVYMQNSIPPEFVKGGYDVLDAKGNLLRRVAPQITDEQKRANEANELAVQEQLALDQELMKAYRSPSDVDRSMTTALSRVDMEIRLKNNRIRSIQNKFNSLQSRAASQERAGQTVGSELVEEMNVLQQEIDEIRAEIDVIEVRKAALRADFLNDRARMVELWEKRYRRTWQDPE